MMARRKRSKPKSVVTPAKAKLILEEGEVRGYKLTPKQKGFFGARAGGASVKRKRKKSP